MYSMAAAPQPTSTKRDYDNLVATLAHHDAAIINLSNQVRSSAESITALSTNVTTGFSALREEINKANSRPTFDIQKSIATVMQLAILFSMVVAGIIYVTGGQFAAVWAEQKAFNNLVALRLDKAELRLDIYGNRQWEDRDTPRAQKQSWTPTTIDLRNQ